MGLTPLSLSAPLTSFHSKASGSLKQGQAVRNMHNLSVSCSRWAKMNGARCVLGFLRGTTSRPSSPRPISSLVYLRPTTSRGSVGAYQLPRRPAPPPCTPPAIHGRVSYFVCAQEGKHAQSHRQYDTTQQQPHPRGVCTSRLRRRVNVHFHTPGEAFVQVSGLQY